MEERRGPVADDDAPEGGGPARSLVPLVRRWWLMLALAFALASVAGFTMAQATATHQVSTRVLVGPVVADAAALRAASQLARTYADLATTKPVLAATAAELPARRSPGALRRSTSVAADDTTRLLTITVKDRSAVVAAAAANEIARQLTRLGGATRGPNSADLLIVDAADAADSTLAPPPLLYAAVAGGAALLAALALAAAIEASRRVVHDEIDLQAAAGCAVVGRAALNAPPDGAWAARATSHRLAAQLLQGRRDEPAWTVLVVDASEGSGAPELAADVAVALCSVGTDVRLVVERRTLEEPPTPPPGGGRLELAALPPVVDDADARRALTELAQGVDVVLVVGPPPSRSAVSLTLAPVCSVVAIAVALGRSRQDDVAATADALRLSGAELVGVVANQLPRRPRRTRPSPSQATTDAIATTETVRP